MRNRAGKAMDKTARGWLRKTVSRESWRVSSVCDQDELLQDGHLIYWRIAVRYPNATEPRHVMALFQRAFANHIIDLSRKRSRTDHVALAGDLNIDLTLIPEAETKSIDDAPEAVRQLVDACAARPDRLRTVPRRCKPDGARETESEWLSRVYGYEVPADAHLQLLAYLRA